MPPAGRTVTVERPGGYDPIGGDPLPSSEHAIDGCVWWPRMSEERTDMRNTVITGYMLSGPFEADLRPTDKVKLPGVVDSSGDPIRWDVDGEVGRWESGYTGRRPGMQVALKRVTG